MAKIFTTLFTLSALTGALMAADAAKADAAPKVSPYPLDTCIVSGEKLGTMGEAKVIVREGREIKLCCKGCLKDFDKDPAKFIKKLDAAGASKAVGNGVAPACCP